MKAGLLLDNLDQVADTSYQKLAAMGAGVVGTLWTAGTTHRRDVYDRCERELQAPDYLVRVGGDRQTPADWINDAIAALLSIPAGAVPRSYPVVGNEPNIEGWAGDPAAYGQFYGAIAQDYKGQNAPIFACPSLGLADWEDYLAKAVAAVGRPIGAIAVNLYAHLLQQLPRVIELCTVDGQAPYIYVTEVNTLEGYPARVDWLRDAFRYLASQGVAAATIFIAGGKSNGAWDEDYIIAQAEASALRNVVAELAQPQAQQQTEVTKPKMRHVMMLWNSTDIIGGLDGALLWKDAIDAVAVKIFDGAAEDQSKWDPNIAFAAQLMQAGMEVEAWGYCYGIRRELKTARTQFAALSAQGGKSPSRLILDSEAEWEASIELDSWLKFGAETVDLPFAVMVSPMMPYRNNYALGVAQLVGDVIPMLYWKDFSVDDGQGHNWQDWNTLVPDWQAGPFGKGWQRPWKSAAISFYGAIEKPNPTIEEIEAFIGVLESRGVETIYYWDWRGCPEEYWLKLRAAKAGQ